MSAETLCLCRDQPAECVCLRNADERRQRISAGMDFAAQVQMAQTRRQVPAAPVPYPVGYGERDAQV